MKTTWRPSGKQLGLLLAISVLAVFAAANAHLVLVAFRSQPECALRLDTPQTGGTVYRAAKPAC